MVVPIADDHEGEKHFSSALPAITYKPRLTQRRLSTPDTNSFEDDSDVVYRLTLPLRGPARAVGSESGL